MNGQSAAPMWHQVHDGLRSFIGKRVENDAEGDDILQEVFLRVHRSAENLKDPERLISWMYQITRNVIIDYYRSAKRRELPVGLLAELEEGNPQQTEPKSTAAAELSGCLRPMLSHLSTEYQEAIRLVELEGVTQKEAADRLGVSLPAMKSRVQRGRQQLRKMLDDCCSIELDTRHGVAGFEQRRPGSPCS